MKKEVKLWQFARDQLKAGQYVMLLIVTDSAGSSPGRCGFKMAVSEHNLMTGSIGGGIMEVKLVELAKKILADKNPQSLVKKQIHDKSASHDQSGMICSGDQTVIYFLLDQYQLPLVDKLLLLLEAHMHANLTLGSDGKVTSFTVSEKTNPEGERYFFETNSEGHFTYRERIGFDGRLFIIGGGHCGLALSELMSKLDFFIHVIDERAELNTMASNDHAHDMTLVPGYNGIAEYIPEGRDVFVVIMTQGYRSDKIIVENLAGKNFAYLGMLGSKNKIDKLKEEFDAAGLPSIFTNVHAPIGIPINSRTPEEIAVSIAAEIISVKNGKQINKE